MKKSTKANKSKKIVRSTQEAVVRVAGRVRQAVDFGKDVTEGIKKGVAEVKARNKKRSYSK